MRLVGAMAAALCGCTFAPGRLAGGDGDAAIATDASGDDGASDGSVADAAPLGPWGTPSPLISGGGGDDDPTLTADMLELYFNRSSDIYVTTRSSIGGAWSTPTRDNELSSAAGETTPEISGDGLTMYLGSARAPSLGAGDIWVSTRASRSAAWGTPTRVDELSSSVEDAASAVTDDLRAIVFISPRGGGVGMADIYLSTRTLVTDAWSAPQGVAINSTANDFSPVLSQDRLTLWFDSDRNGNSDLYVATRPSVADAFGSVTPIDELNSSGAESDIWVSRDLRRLIFVRDGVMYESVR